MPWEENCAMDQRLGFVGMDLAGELSMTELCEAFSIRRKGSSSVRTLPSGRLT
jgi:hypothetical protein